MTADRFEWTGLGAAAVLHVALIAAMSIGLANAVDPEPPAMEVDFVSEEVALEAAAPTPVPQPPAAAAPAQAEAAPVPDLVQPPMSAAREVPMPTARPQPRPQPQRQAQARPQRQAPTRPAPPQRREGIGDDFLSGFGDAPKSAPAAPAYSAQAKANVASSIARQAQRCANRQPYLGEGADQLSMNVKLYFARSGRLARPPVITGMSGAADLRSKYGELLEDQVRRIFADCAPFRLPAELYDTGSGGWKETTLRYRVNK